MQAVLRAAITEFGKGLSTSLIVLAGQSRCPICPDCHCAPVLRCSGGERAQEDTGAAGVSFIGALLLLVCGAVAGWAGALYIRPASTAARARPVVKGKGVWLADISDGGSVSSEHGSSCALSGTRAR